MNTATLAADLDRLNSACDLCEQPPAHHVYYGRAGEHTARTNDLCPNHAARWDHAALSPDELDRLYATARIFSGA